MANTAGLKDIKDFIAKDESGGDYEVYNFGKSGGSGIRSSTPSSKYYKADAIKLTTKTIREILVLQRSSNNPLGKGDLFAVGKYQLIPGTLYSIASKLNYLDKRYDITTQEELGNYLVLNKRKDTGNYINSNNSGDQKDLERAIQALGLEFASFPIITKDGKNWGNVVTGTGNKAYYGGQGPNPANSKYSVKDVVLQLIKARIQYSGKDPLFIPTYYNGSKSSSTDKVTISGKAVDSQGKPISGATVNVTQTLINLSEPILNETTGKYEVKDENGNIIAESTKRNIAKSQASTKVLAQSTQQQINNPQPSTPSANQSYPDTPFKTSTESDEFRKWLLNKYPNYGTQEGKYKVDPPPQPNYINTDALKKAWSEKGTEYNTTNLKFTSFEDVSPTAIEEPVTVVTDKDGNWKVEYPSTGFNPSSTTITFSKEGHEVRTINNIQQTSTNEVGDGKKTYEVPRVQMPPTPDVTATATSKINQEVLTEEKKLLKQQGNSELSFQEKFAVTANNKKEEIKKTLIPFVIKLLAPFGAIVLQAIVSKIPLSNIKDQISCPSQGKILELINKRNKLVKQINNAYKTITTLSKILLGVNTTITIVQAGILVIETLPYPATGFPPLGLPPLTTGIIEITGTGKDKLKEALKKAKVVINIVTLALAAFGAVLGIILRLLNNLDTLIQQCAQEQNLPFEAINDELNTFVNQSTGISNSTVIQSTQQNDTYKGFKLEIKLDDTNSSVYPRRYAQALTKTGVPVLKTDSSFASDPQVLLDQLKFIIDSNPQLTAE